MSEDTNIIKDENTMPFYQHEIEMARMGVQAKRWFIAFLIVLCMLFATNIFWVERELSYEDEVISYEVSQETGENGTVNYLGNQVNVGW